MDRKVQPANGLLEQTTLFVRQEQQERILLSLDGDRLGFTRWQRHGWLWSEVALFEQEQSPLVCTVRRRFTWPFRREVRDAESDLVGFLTGDKIQDRWDREIMRYSAGLFLDERGQELASYLCYCLRFLDSVQHDPFAKMLIVAFVITH